MKNLTGGTPNDLETAIENGICEAVTRPVGETPAVIAAHVKDFIRNKLSPYFLKYDKPGSEEAMSVLAGLEEKLGCKMTASQAKQLDERIQSMVSHALAKASND